MKNAFILFFLLSSYFASHAQTETIRKQHFNIEKSGLAIRGYDPVAYISEQKAKEGKQEITYAYKGITYRFSSESNKTLFAANPQKYEPAYGGWCAYAMNYAGKKVSVDPETFKVIDGKTYLFYNFYFNNTLSDWNKNEAVYKPKADQNWNKIVAE